MRQRYRIGLVCLGLFSLVFVVFSKALVFEFLNWDDYQYVVHNPFIKSVNWATLSQIFGLSIYWMPLTWLSHALDSALFGLDPGPHHLFSIVIHSANTVLVFMLFGLLVGAWYKVRSGSKKPIMSYFYSPSITSHRVLLWIGLFIAILWGTHPMRVESVAWISERKDVLYAFWTLVAYVFYVFFRTNKRCFRWYVACLVAFILSLASKPMGVAFPFTLFILDWVIYPKLSLKGWLYKVPFFGGAIGVAILAILGQQEMGAFISTESLGLLDRCMIGIRNVSFYWEQTFFPFFLSPFYPHYTFRLFSDVFIISILFVTIVSSLSVWMFVKKKNRFLGLGWLYYGLTVGPVLGLTLVGGQARADRWAYLTTLGGYFLLGLGLFYTWTHKGDLWAKRPVKALVFAIVSVIICGNLWLTWSYLEVWRSSESLWSRVIELYPKKVARSYSSLAVQYMDSGDYEQALPFIRQALEVNLKEWDSRVYLAVILYKTGKSQEAFQALSDILVENPTMGMAAYHRGVIARDLSEYDSAVMDFQLAIQSGFNTMEAMLGLALTHLMKGDSVQALDVCNHILMLDSRSAAGFFYRAIAYDSLGKEEDALRDFYRCVSLNPEYRHSAPERYRKRLK